VADNPSRILTINGGSSSIKFALYRAATNPEPVLSGEIERIGTPEASMSVKTAGATKKEKQPIKDSSFAGTVKQLAEFIKGRVGNVAIAGVGHRIVQGGANLLEHQRVTPEVIAELHRMEPLDLSHLPREIELLEAFSKAFPDSPQVACFDTVFHRDLPRVAQLLPIPRRYFNQGVRRFGFHGISYTYLMSELERIAGQEPAAGRVILAHLGSGASMAAVHAGKPIDTTMAFTAMAGLVMGTRPGDLDPGLVVYLMDQEKKSAPEMEKFFSTECGMLGISETSSDMRNLLAARESDPRAAEAFDIFCMQARKHLCAMAAALGGVDTIVFSGGIGEHTPQARAAICDGLDFIGVRLDPKQNDAAAPVISTTNSNVTVRIIATDEEVVIARITHAIITNKPR
jgi:acetate kinase